MVLVLGRSWEHVEGPVCFPLLLTHGLGQSPLENVLSSGHLHPSFLSPSRISCALIQLGPSNLISVLRQVPFEPRLLPSSHLVSGPGFSAGLLLCCSKLWEGASGCPVGSPCLSSVRFRGNSPGCLTPPTPAVALSRLSSSRPA